nr:MAG: RNA-dependent RNA polymerase [Permutotetraviridae sp.]
MMAQREDFKKLTLVAEVAESSSEGTGDEQKAWKPKGQRPRFGTGFQMDLGDLLDADLGTNPDKLDLTDLIRKVNKKRTAKEQRKHDLTAELCPIPEPPVVAPMPKKWNADHVKEFMQAMRQYGVKPLAALARDPRDPHYKKEGGVANLMTHHMTFNSVSKDGDMYMNLAMLPVEKFAPAVINQVRAELAAANEWTMTNGPSSGLYHRLKTGLERPKPAFKAADYLPYVLKHFPIQRDLLKNLAGMGARDLRWVRVDFNTGYGSPFMKPKVGPEGNFLPQMMSIAGEIMAAIANGTIGQWSDAHPALCVALLKNKLDKYLATETAQKIRPYYTYPAHWNVLFSAIWQSISDAALTFLEHPDSINAHGFSWARGGAQKLYLWIVSKKDPGVYVVAYSDDQLWLVVTRDGKKYLIFPDYKMMDMSLGVPFGGLSHAWLSDVYEGRWDKTWSAVAELNCKMAFEKAVLVAFALFYLIRGGLGSGIPGTAEFDQIASCAAMKFIVPALSGLAHLEELRTALAGLATRLKLRLGLEIKPETLAVHEFVPEQDYPWFSFLGHAIRRVKLNDKHIYVPVRPRDKLVLSYVQPKGSYSKDGYARIRALQTRLIGITASGGWYHDEYYYAAKRMYEYYATEYQLTPAPENDMTYAEYLQRPATIQPKPWSSKEFPPRTWFQSLVAPWDVQATADATADEGDRKTVTLSSVWQPGKGWDEVDHDTFDQDIGATNLAPPKETTDAAKQGRVEPLPAAVKAAYNAKVAALRLSLRAAYATGMPLGPGKGRAKGTKVAAWLMTQADEFEAAAEAAIEDESYTPPETEVPDDVLDEMHEERLTAEDLSATYMRALRVRHKTKGGELPPWVGDGLPEEDE